MNRKKNLRKFDVETSSRFIIPLNESLYGTAHQSGADQDFIRVKPEEQPEDDGKPQKTNEGKKSSGVGQ